MTDGTNEGPGGGKPGGPLSDTFPEFVKYARNRQQKSARSPAPPPPPPPPRITVKPALVAGVTVIALCGIVLWSRDPGGAPPPDIQKTPPPSPTDGRPSSWVDLPRPRTMGQVPDRWGALELGMKLEDVPAEKRAPYTHADRWADWIYRPDANVAEKQLGLSFHKGRLYKIAVRFGEDSTIPAGDYLMACQVAYGESRGYEYLTPGFSHAVTIFQTDSRAIRLDSVKGKELIALAEVVLLDLEVATQRELARARGEK